LKSAKIISVFLTLVFVLQLLPVKQVIRYFYIDNAMAEELLHTAENPSKNVSLFGEEADLIKNDLLSFTFLPAPNPGLSNYEIVFPSTHAADIETPPPNSIIN
jgi:hypothetical protein